MNDFEESLRGMRLARPSPELDQRIDRMLQSAAVRARPEARRWWWLAVPAAGAVAAALVLALKPPARPVSREPLIYHVEAEGMMREWLAPASMESRPPTVVVVGIGSTHSSAP
jgi:hypothetical protein